MSFVRSGSLAAAILSWTFVLAFASTCDAAVRPVPGAVTAARERAAGARREAHARLQRHAAPAAFARRSVTHAVLGAGAGTKASVPDGLGGTYVAWSEAGRDGWELDVVLQRVTSSGTVAPGWPADGVPVCSASGSQILDDIVSDGANGVIVVWTDQRASLQTADLYAQRVNTSGTPQWTTNGVVLLPNLIDQAPEFASDGTGGVLAAWIAPGATDDDVFATRLDANGSRPAGWSASGTLVCDAEGDQSQVGLTNDGAGGAYLAWQDQRPENPTPMVYAQHVSPAAAAQWTANGILLGEGSSYDHVALCRDGATGALVFWADPTGGTIVGVRLNPVGLNQWGGPVSLSDALDYAYDPWCATDGQGGAIVLFGDYTQSMENELRAQHVSSTGTLAWGSGGARVSKADSLAGMIHVVLPGPAGDAYVLWDDMRHYPQTGALGLWGQHIASDGSATWSADGVPVFEGLGFFFSWSSAVVDNSGSLLAAWADLGIGLTFASFSPIVRVQSMNTSGVAPWGATGQVLFRYPGVQNACAPITTSAGGVFAIYPEYDPLGGRAGMFRVFDANGQPVFTPRTFTTGAVLPELSPIASDGAGGALVTWMDQRNGSGDFDAYAQRLTSAGNLAWTSSGVLLAGGPGTQRATSLAADGSGGMFVAWESIPSGGGSSAFVQHLDASGATTWGASGVNVGAATYTLTEPKLVPDGSGGVIVAFVRTTTPGLREVAAQRVDASGAKLWGADGVAISSYPDTTDTNIASIAAGLSHDAIVTTLTYWTDATRNVYANEYNSLAVQRVDASGVPAWGPHGLTIVRDTLAVVVNAASEPDGSGGVYVAWTSVRTAGADVYMQHVTSAGSAQWTAGGVAVCNASDWQLLGGLTRDPAGDEYLVWSDARSGSYDVYAQRMNGAGAAQWTANGALVCNAARGQFAAAIAPFRTASPGRLFVGWADNRLGDARYAYVQRLDLAGTPQWSPNGTVGTTLSLASSDASADGVRLTWFASNHVVASVERRSDDEDWRTLGEVASDGSGYVRFEDRDVVAGAAYDYRLRFADEGGVVTAGQVHVLVPNTLRLSLAGARPNPAVRELALAFTLPTRDPATLELLDLAGRRVATRSLAGLEPGAHVLALGRGTFPAGVYFARLTQAGRSVQQRIVLLR